MSDIQTRKLEPEERQMDMEENCLKQEEGQFISFQRMMNLHANSKPKSFTVHEGKRPQEMKSRGTQPHCRDISPTIISKVAL
jgi:hypothetical protein